MMKLLLKKELRLALHPTAPLFLLLSAMLLIPNYPYCVVFFYTSLGIFFICLSGRENQDIFYSMLLPIRKSDVVTARFLLVVLLEVAQLVLAIPFAWLRQTLLPIPNLVGMDANISLFGFALIQLGLFNWVFFRLYYRNVAQVGKSFAAASVVSFLFLFLVEGLTHILPLFRDVLDTPDPQFLGPKLAALGLGLLSYLLLTGLAYRRGKRDFEGLDL